MWQGLLVAAVLKSALLFFSKKNPQLRYALSTIAMIANLLLPLATFSIIYSSELAFTKTSISSLALTDLMLDFKQPDSFFSYQELGELLPSFLPYIALLWLATVVLLAGKLLIEIYNVNKLPQQASIEPSTALLLRFNELAKQINLRNPPRLLISLKVDVPMAIGWLKPVVLIPATMISGLNTAQLEMLMLHELAHIRRHDYLVNFLQTFVEILLFFHPSVLWVSKQMRNEREYCSDDIAVQHCGDAVAYAHTLADTASLCTKNHHHTIPSMAMAASGGDLKQRVIRLIDHHCAPQNNISKWLASATIIFSVLLLSSKQLLTMPLLDLWHSDTPFNKKNIIDDDITPVKNLANNIVSSGNNDLSTSSIAKQLLAPQVKPFYTSQELTAKKAAPAITLETNNLPIIANNQTSKLSNNIQTTQQEISSNRSAELPKQSDSIAMKESTESLIRTNEEHNNINSTATISMVEQAIGQTDSKQKLGFNTSNSGEFAQLKASNDESTQTSLLPLNKQDKNTEFAQYQFGMNLNHSQESAFQHESSSSSVNLKQRANLVTKQQQLNALEEKFEQRFSQELSQGSTPIMQNAKLLESANPVYPSVAKRKGIEIEVKVDFTIDINGQIKDIHFAHQNRVNYFKSSIRAAIKKWKFSPAKLGDEPIESQMSKVFAFSLHS